jgi:hypothetical protein
MATGTISPVLKAETGTIAWSADKFGSIKLTYASWEDAKMVLKGQVMHIRWGDQGVEARIIPDDLLMAAVQKSMVATMAAQLDTLADELAALATNRLWTLRAVACRRATGRCGHPGAARRRTRPRAPCGRHAAAPAP